jgi:hypothetical protein
MVSSAPSAVVAYAVARNKSVSRLLQCIDSSGLACFLTRLVVCCHRVCGLGDQGVGAWNICCAAFAVCGNERSSRGRAGGGENCLLAGKRGIFGGQAREIYTRPRSESQPMNKDRASS